MVKKRVSKRKGSNKKSAIRKNIPLKRKSSKRVYVRTIKTPTPMMDENTKNLLVENFVGLQKVVIDLGTRVDSLVQNMSKLLSLFETSAEALVKKDFDIVEISKKKKSLNKEGGSNSGGFDRERSFGSTGALLQPNNIPEFQRIPSQQMNSGNMGVSGMPNEYSLGNQNIPMQMNSQFNMPMQGQPMQNMPIQQNPNMDFSSNFNNFQENNVGGQDIPLLPPSSTEGEVPGSS